MGKKTKKTPPPKAEPVPAGIFSFRAPETVTGPDGLISEICRWTGLTSAQVLRRSIQAFAFSEITAGFRRGLLNDQEMDKACADAERFWGLQDYSAYYEVFAHLLRLMRERRDALEDSNIPVTESASPADALEVTDSTYALATALGRLTDNSAAEALRGAMVSKARWIIGKALEANIIDRETFGKALQACGATPDGTMTAYAAMLDIILQRAPDLLAIDVHVLASYNVKTGRMIQFGEAPEQNEVADPLLTEGRAE